MKSTFTGIILLLEEKSLNPIYKERKNENRKMAFVASGVLHLKYYRKQNEFKLQTNFIMNEARKSYADL